MRADEFLKKYGLDGDEEELKDSSLKGKSLERALHPGRPKAGTPHDWEEWEAYKATHGIVEDDLPRPGGKDDSDSGQS
ncbi:hypothetical protein SAMN05216421_3132 [Halopseudomonas xinjiangensis]|uniref:Uncharacterized protein n=1 Tax=Halopseudomonas xinjiangensis TaxID=487184 RepID=A0A1H1YEI5_9GAMM|nr:hypothetical protein [Halopseudomonas xinjiangensis]SDT19850.1 hypothetical protein SAMN05216421_3132 [Halopseudomonas xinjiangensis]